MDGANMNAQVGLCRPGDYRRRRLPPEPAQDLLHPARRRRPGHGPDRRRRAPRAVPARPPGGADCGGAAGDRPGLGGALGQRRASCRSPGCYIALMGGRGPDAGHPGRDPERQLHGARGCASHYPVLYTRRERAASRTSSSSTCGRSRRPPASSVDDVAKRLMDYGFHAPTMSLAGGRHADDRADRERVEGRARPLLRRDDRDPRRDPRRSTTARSTARTTRCRTRRTPPSAVAGRRLGPPLQPASRPPSRRRGSRRHKFWPPVGRIDNVYGDRNLVCTCDPVESYEDEPVPAEEPAVPAAT